MNEEQTEEQAEEQAKAIPGRPGTVKRLFVAHRLEHPAVNRELDEAWRKVHQIIPRWSKPPPGPLNP